MKIDAEQTNGLKLVLVSYQRNVLLLPFLHTRQHYLLRPLYLVLWEGDSL